MKAVVLRVAAGCLWRCTPGSSKVLVVGAGGRSATWKRVESGVVVRLRRGVAA